MSEHQEQDEFEIELSQDDEGWTAIPHRAMRDERLSIEARGLLALLLGYGNGWRFRSTHLQRVAGVGRDKFFRMRRELEALGYLSFVDRHDPTTGHFTSRLWRIRPVGHRVTENPTTVDPTTAEPGHGESGQLRTSRDKNIKGRDAGASKPTQNDLFSGGQKKRRTQFPPTWRPGPDLVAWVMSQGFREAEIVGLAQACVDHHRGRGNTFLDHDAAFRTWCRNEVKFRQQRQQRGAAPAAAGDGDALIRRAMRG